MGKQREAEAQRKHRLTHKTNGRQTMAHTHKVVAAVVCCCSKGRGVAGRVGGSVARVCAFKATEGVELGKHAGCCACQAAVECSLECQFKSFAAAFTSHFC